MNNFPKETNFTNVPHEQIVEIFRSFPLEPSYYFAKFRAKGIPFIDVFVDNPEKKMTEYYSECRQKKVIPFSTIDFNYLSREYLFEIKFEVLGVKVGQFMFKQKKTIMDACLSGGQVESLEIRLFDDEARESFETLRKKGGFMDKILSHNYEFWSGAVCFGYSPMAYHKGPALLEFEQNEVALRMPEISLIGLDLKKLLPWKAQVEYELNKIKYGVGLDYC